MSNALALLFASLLPSVANAQGVPGGPDGGSPGNVLILLADDLGVDYLASYGLGSNPANTPNLDALAASGVQFRNCWTNPVCSPTRALVMTGRHAFRTGQGYLADAQYALPLAEVTLPEMLDLGTAGAWDHAAFGKWHLGNATVGGDLAPNMAGWGHWSGSMDNLQPGDYFNWTKVVDGVPGTVTNYATTETVDDALAWIATAQEPWLCYVAFHAGHTPLHAPPPALHTVDLTGAGPPSTDPVPYYRAMVEAMDTEIGRLLGGIGSNTTVAFLGDNGSPQNVTLPPFDPSHSKGRLFEGGINVPLIVSGPQVTTPGESQALVGAVDVFATVAEIAGVDPAAVVPGTLDSVSFLPHVADPALPSTRPTMFAERFWPNGPQSDPPIPPPVGTFCQPNLGFAGPGTVSLSVCGGLLAENDSAVLDLAGMSPGAVFWIVISPTKSPLPVFGGTLVPNPVFSIYSLVADGHGEFSLTLKGGSGPVTLYTQAVVFEPLLPPTFFAFSNAVQVDFLNPSSKAIRDDRYKLIVSWLGGPDQFYDLQADPFEQDDLLVSGMTAPETAAYNALKAEITAFVTTP